MLFAKDWIYETFHRIARFIESIVSNVTLESASGAINGSYWILIPCILCGLLLCFYGFRLHKLVNGILGGVLFGCIGWYVGLSTGSSFVTVPLLYTFVFSICGFFLLFILCVLNIFTLSFLLAHMLCVAFLALTEANQLLAMTAFALLYTILYARFKPVMTAVTGALALGVIAYQYTGLSVGAISAAALAVAGIVLQLIWKRLYDRRITREQLEEIQKYPYGPGQRDAMKAARNAIKNLNESEPASPRVLNGQGADK